MKTRIRQLTEQNFVKIMCNCGCKKKYYSFVNKPSPSKYEIISYTHGKYKKVLSIKRLLDGETFTLGDTIQRITPRNKKYNKAVIYDIQVEESGFMQIHSYCINSGGIAIIKNEKYDYTGNNPNLFNYIINVTNAKKNL